MQVAFHVGVHGSDEDRVAQWLAGNAALLASHGVEVPTREVEEPILTEALASLKGGVASTEMCAVVLDALLERDGARRLVVSRASLLGRLRRAMDGDALLAGAGERMRALANLFPGHEVSFHLALKNPAIYVSDALSRPLRSRAAGEGGHARLDPEQTRWLPAVQAMLAALGDTARLVVWCNEDTPLIFPEVMRRLSGVEPGGVVAGDTAAAERVLRPAGAALLAERLAGLPADDVRARRRAIEAVLAEYHDPAAIRREVAVPGWDQSVVDRVTANYRIDIASIAALPGIEFLAA